MPAEASVVLADPSLELAPMLAARIPVRAVHATAVPREPTAGIGVHVLAVAQVEQLALKGDLGR
jgi:hypothetical protein